MKADSTITAMETACVNTDRELWREKPGGYYANSIHVTEGGGIGINVGGTVIVRTLAQWHALATVMTATFAAAGDKEGARADQQALNNILSQQAEVVQFARENKWPRRDG